MNDVEKLRATLEELGAKNRSISETLEERKKLELQFHDQHRDRCQIQKSDEDTVRRRYGNHKYYRGAVESKKYVEDWIRGNAEGKVVLDFACGDGGNALLAAGANAGLSIGIDLSQVSVMNAQQNALEKGLERKCVFLQADCENTGFPEECIDVIICSGMLHHLDLSVAMPEMRRMLKPNGKILIVEALAYNPLIRLYRKLTPAMRTKWEAEHILNMKDVRFASKFFDVENVRFWHILSPLAGFVGFLFPILNVIDRALVRIPLIRLMAWQFTVELHRP